MKINTFYVLVLRYLNSMSHEIIIDMDFVWYPLVYPIFMKIVPTTLS